MLKNRAIRLSLKNRIQAMLQAPESGSGLAPFNVYNEVQFRSASRDMFSPVFPYVYLLDAFMPPASQAYFDKQSPQIVVEIDRYATMPFELGTRSGRIVTACVHVFGQNRGQRDDLASFIVDYIGTTLTIYDFTAENPAGVAVETALIDNEKVVEDVYTPRLDLLLAGGIEFGHTMVTLSFKPKL